jgi:hypothetical protein
MANPPYKQKMGEPPIFRFSPESGGAKCNKNHAQIQHVGDFFCLISGMRVACFFQASPCFAIRFAMQADGTAPLLTASGNRSGCYRGFRTPPSKSTLLNAPTSCAVTSCFDIACWRLAF